MEAQQFEAGNVKPPSASFGILQVHCARETGRTLHHIKVAGRTSMFINFT